MKSKEELDELKKEVSKLNEKLSELTEEELMQVTGGGLPLIFFGSADKKTGDVTPKDRDIAF